MRNVTSLSLFASYFTRGKGGGVWVGGRGGKIGVPALISELKQYPPFMNMLKTFFLKFIRPAISFLIVEGLTTFLRVDSFSF